MVRLDFWGNGKAEINEADIECLVTLTRYTDLVNNSDKWRRIFTVHTPGYRPYTWTQTGRWTHQTAGGNWSGGTMRPGKVVSNAAWQRGGSTHAGLHANEVLRQKKDYTVSGRTETLTWPIAKAFLQRLSPNPVTNGSAPQPNVKPHLISAQPVNTAGPAQPQPTFLGNRIQKLLAAAMDENTDPFDLFADVAMLKKELAETQADMDRMAMDLKLANETILNRVV